MKQGWKIKKLKEICAKITDGTHQTPKYFDEGVIFLSSKNVTSGKIDWDNIKYIDEKQHLEMHKRVAPRVGDILLAKNGTTGVAAMVDRDVVFDIYVSLAHIRVLEEVTPEFMLYFINSPIAKKQFNKRLKGSGVPNLHLEEIREVEILLPPLSEQQRIVAILDEVFEAIAKAKANAEQNLKNAKELFDVYLHKFYTSKEEGWEEKKLKEVAEYFNGLTYSPKNVSNEGIIVLRSSNVQNDVLDFKDIVRVNLNVKEKIIVKEGDILMCSRNGSARLVGKTATIKNLNEEMTFGTFMMIVRSQYNPYLSWFFKSTDFRNQIKGGGNTMINQITRYMLDDVVISFPPIEKQNEVVQKLNALHLEIKKLEAIYQQKINDLEELKKSVLQKAFAGELKEDLKEHFAENA